MLSKWLKRVGYTFLVLFILVNIIAAFHAYKFTHFMQMPILLKSRSR